MARSLFVCPPRRRPDFHGSEQARDVSHRPCRSVPALRALLLALAALLAPAVVAAGTLHGRVVDPDGRPVPGARVLLAQPLGIEASTTTGPDGRFRIEHVSGGPFDVLVIVPGLHGGPVAVTIRDDEVREIDIALHISGVTESVVVSAAQVDLPLSRATDSIAVLAGADMAARQHETIADALDLVPGLATTRTGGPGAVTSLFPRGGESDFTLVFVDGIPVNAFGGGMDLTDLPVAGIERVEVVRGPQSALFGSDAIGGVVQVVTKQGGGLRTEGSLEAGSLRRTRAAFSTTGSRGRWSWGGAAARMASRGFTGVAPATGETVTNDDWLAGRGSASVGWRTDGGTDVRANAHVGRNERGYPGPFGSNPLGIFTAVDRLSRGIMRTRGAGLRVLRAVAWRNLRIQPRAQVTWFEATSRFESLYGLSDAASHRVTVRAQADVQGSGWPVRVSLGAEVKAERASSTFITGEGPDPLPVRRRIVGTFVEAAYQPRARVSLTAGLRVEQIRRDRLEANPWLPRPAFDVERLTSANPKVSVAWQVLDAARTSAPGWREVIRLDGLRLRAAAGTGIRPPDALEIAFTDNPRLRPERSESAEAGIEGEFRQGAVVLGATGFLNAYDDLIVAVGPDLRDASRFRTDNISNARSRGIELSGSMRTRSGLDARIAYTFLDTSILALDGGAGRTPVPFRAGDPLPRRPRHRAAIDLLLLRGRFTGFASAGARSRTLDVEPSWGAAAGLFWNPGYTVAEAGAGWRLTRAIEVVGRVSNLLDRRYEEAFGFPSPGRTLTVGVRLAAGR